MSYERRTSLFTKCHAPFDGEVTVPAYSVNVYRVAIE
jgi:hypothetical protein